MKSSKLALLYEYPKFLKDIKHLNNIMFFFPFYHFGGGETVHLDILKIFKDYKTSCFITQESDNDFLKEDFNNAAEIINIWKYKSSKYDIYCKTLAKAINKKENPIVFGCNNKFFYRLVKHLDENKVRIIDLTHAFSYEDPSSVEKFSLPFVHKIHRRVILGKKTYADFKNLYLENNIDLKFLDRLSIINNKVEIPINFPSKPFNEKIKVLFVSRNSFEKRPELFFEIAKRCHERKINASFTVIGNFDDIENDIPNINIIGSIKEKEKLNDLYLIHDLLLITSFREGLPMVILEGMAYGTVPICTNVGEISSFINNENNNGIVLNDISIERYSNTQPNYRGNNTWYPTNKLVNIPEDLESIIENFIASIESLDKDRNRLEKMSKNAYNTVINNFSTEINRNAYLKVFFE